jgi:hypothetical protein
MSRDSVGASKATMLLCLLGVALAGVVGAPSASGRAGLPDLAVARAESVATAKLDHDFGGMFTNAGRSQRRLNCGERLSNSHRRCRVFWFLGDTAYGGVVRVWLKRCAEAVCTESAYRIEKTDDYCVYERRRSRRACTTVYTSRVFLNARGRYGSAPARFGWGSTGEWRGVRWSGWGDPVARGTGTVVFAIVQSGGGYEYPRYPGATIRLSRIRRCGVRLSYTRVDIAVPDLPEVGGVQKIGCYGL